MLASELLDRFARAGRRAALIGDARAGVIAGLDLEGRLYAVLDGEVLNRTNPDAITGISTATSYLNPGGDGLWPAPEGTRFGYNYATGRWRVPPALTGMRAELIAGPVGSATLCADLDLINSQGMGIPIRAERQVRVEASSHGVVLISRESFTYLGTRTLASDEALLAPWSLSQFDCGPGCETVFPDDGHGGAWDLYGPSDGERRLEAGLWRVRTAGDKRFQLGIPATVPWIEFRHANGLRVRRGVEMPADQRLIDIADRAPDQMPDQRGCRYSIYNDANGFMEIEAAGGMPPVLRPGACLSMIVTTAYSRSAAP